MKNILSIPDVSTSTLTSNLFVLLVWAMGALQLLSTNLISSPLSGWYVLPEQLGLPHGVHLAGAVGGGLQAAPGQAHLHAVQVSERGNMQFSSILVL